MIVDIFRYKREREYKSPRTPNSSHNFNDLKKKLAKPSILFVTGSFALPVFYDEIINAIAANGYETKALHLPSVGLDSGLGREGGFAADHVRRCCFYCQGSRETRR